MDLVEGTYPRVSEFGERVAKRVDLKPGEWILFCHCGWVAPEKNAGMKNECPDCLAGLRFVEERS